MIEPKTFFPNVVVHKMDTPFTIKLAVINNDSVVKQILHTTTKLIEEDLEKIERKFSMTNSDSLISKYRQGETEAVARDPMFQEVFGQCNLANDFTNGYFDAFDDGKFDPSELIKGWAIERLFQLHLKPLLIAPNIIGVSFGDDKDIQMASKADSDFQWDIGINDPNRVGVKIAEYRIENGAISTTQIKNDNVRSFDRHVPCLKQVSVITTSLTRANAWSSVAVSAGVDNFKRLIGDSGLTGVMVDSCSVLTAFTRGKISDGFDKKIS
ncbi:FAD:protein FMN transferase [Companilactobacillus furfuricola]|uniref:FAD:protein FMN transferase n=1 Tax=Companilactobacillus furfuricola TaxID=1462575 RepID=UPI000F78625C|nr:FAD:protein FMN transferase [Companilactobacillus furfuricola]